MTMRSKYSPRPLKPLNDESLKALPPPGIHPLVRVHPENRRKALFLNPVRIEGIVGMPDDEALDLVAELMAHATQRKYEYRHQWALRRLRDLGQSQRDPQGQSRL